MDTSEGSVFVATPDRAVTILYPTYHMIITILPPDYQPPYPQSFSRTDSSPTVILTGDALKPHTPNPNTMSVTTPRKLTSEERAARDQGRIESEADRRMRFDDGAPMSGQHVAKLADLPVQECTAYHRREFGYILQVNKNWYFGNSALNRACEVNTPLPFKFRVRSTDRVYQNSKVFDIEYQ